jgi:hypothetical protein
MVYIGRLRHLILAGSLAGVLACQQIPTEDPTTTADMATETGSDPTQGSGDPTQGSGDPTQGQSLPEYRCDPADLSTCADDEKCTAVLQGGLQNLYDCVPKDSLHDLYEACSPAPENGQDACPPSTICAWDTPEGSTGICVPLCVNDGDCAGGSCIENTFNDVPICADSCDPQVPVCKTGLECRQTNDAFACQFPTEVDIGQETAQCLVEGDRGCSQGYVCEAGQLIPNCASPTGFCCTPLCDTEAADTCASPATCNPAFTDPAPGYEWVGACYVPN